MNKEQLKHIFENSACLSPKQLRMYASGKMVHEEAHAAEMHLLSCPLCNDAVEGLMEENSPEAFKQVEKQDASFLAQHIDLLTAEEDLNKDSGSKKAPFKTNIEGGSVPVRKYLKPVGIAASVLVVVGVLWFMRDSIFPEKSNTQIAQNTEVSSQPEPTANEFEVSTRPVDTIEAGTMPAEGDSSMQLLADATPVENDIDEKAAPVEETTKDKKKEELLAKKTTPSVDEVEKLAKRNTLADASPVKEEKVAKPVKEPIAADVQSDKYAARMGNSYEQPKKATETLQKTTETAVAAAPPKKKIELGTASSGILKGDEAFNEGKYKKALRQYQKIMFDPKSNQRDAATLMAAKCHIAMDEKMQAETLLNSLIKENSSKKGEAAGLLNKIEQ